MEKNVKQIVEQVIKDVEVKNPGQSEFHQTIEEVLTSLIPVLEKNPAYVDAKILDRLVEPERQIMFRVPWVDDKGKRHEGNANAKGRWLDDYLKDGKKRNFAPDTFAKLYKKNAGL